VNCGGNGNDSRSEEFAEQAGSPGSRARVGPPGRRTFGRLHRTLQHLCFVRFNPHAIRLRSLGSTLFQNGAMPLVKISSPRSLESRPTAGRSPARLATGCFHGTYYVGAETRLDEPAAPAERVDDVFLVKPAVYNLERAFRRRSKGALRLV